MSTTGTGDAALTEVKLDTDGTGGAAVTVRKPKRIVHCSDGVYEEYSDDEGKKP